MESTLKEQYVGKNNYSKDILHIFEDNVPVKAHNELIFAQLDSPTTSIEVTDQVPESQQPTPEETLSLKNRKHSHS